MSTLDCLLEHVRWTLRRGGPADLLCDDLSILSRSPNPLHRHRPLSRVSSPCRWTTTLNKFHWRKLDADRIRTVADESQEQEVLMCDLGEFVLLIFVRCRGRMMTLCACFNVVSSRSGVNSFVCSIQK